jgi:hypothetical protein
MSSLRVEAALLRAVLPELVLREGMRIVATVAERAGQKGIIVLAGTPLAAQLPDDVKAGDVLRLVVAETSSERVVLRIADPAAAAAAAAPVSPPTVGVPLPGGMTARVTVDERDGGRGGADASREHHELRVTYASASLGRMELHLALAGDEALRVHVRARAGAPFELAERHATQLADAIGAATGKPAQVTVSPRHDPLDVYA